MRLGIERKEFPQCILFDFDRTLIFLYEEKTLLDDLCRIMKDYYKDFIDVNAIEDKDGYFVWHDAHRKIEEKYDIKEALKINEKAEIIVSDFELDVVTTKELFPGVIESIKKIYSMGISLGIVSSNSTSVIKHVLTVNEIVDYFDGVFGRTIPFNPNLVKPNPKPLIDAINLLKHDTSTTWYVGDDIIDIKAANQAGVQAIGVSTGNYSKKILLNEGAKMSFDGIVNLTKYLTDRWRA